MARSDLLAELVATGLSEKQSEFQRVVQSIIAEERAKKHGVLAERLDKLLSNARAERHPPETNGRAINGHATGSKWAESASAVEEKIPERTLSELVLPEPTRLDITDWVEEHHRVSLLRSHNIEPRNRCLLVGPPGNGKTTLAEAIAEAIMVPLLTIRYDRIVTSYLGETATRLRQVFEYASTRKCVLFLDEFETLGKERGDRNETGEIKRIVSSLLMQFDSLPSHVIVIAATNHAELLDRAAWRRFQIRLSLPKPTTKQLEVWFKDYSERLGQSLGLSPRTLVQKVKPTSFADAEEFANSVIRRHVLGQPELSMAEAVDRQLQSWKHRVQPPTEAAPWT